jgi:undecaprenyl-diphosphatase
MTLIQAFVLGIVQGATEFLPISSSAHLVLVPWLLNWEFDPKAAFIFNVLVQWGTLLAVVFYFRHDLHLMARAVWHGLRMRKPFHDPEARLAWLVLAASIPATIVGVALKTQVSQTFENPLAVSLLLLVTAAVLFFSERIGKPDRALDSISTADSLWIGFAQASALFPGISRSGATIATGLARRLQRPHAARFSFLIAIPVMIGAGLVAVLDLTRLPNGDSQVSALIVGFFTAVIVGYFAIRWLIHFLSHKSLSVFAAYCAVVGGLGLLLSVIRG